MAADDPRAKLISDLLIRYKLSARWLAKKVGASHVAVNSWINGEKSPRDKNQWDRMLQTIRSEISTGVKETSPDYKVTRSGARTIKVAGAISAGIMTSGGGDEEDLTVLDWGTDHPRWGRFISGYSMMDKEGDGLLPGDIAVFEDRPYEPYHVVHAFDSGEDTVKVVRGSGQSVELVPINPDYPTLSAKRANVKGVLVMRIRRGPNGERTTTEFPSGMYFRVVRDSEQKTSN